jgi:hypothetical protein
MDKCHSSRIVCQVFLSVPQSVGVVGGGADEDDGMESVDGGPDVAANAFSAAAASLQRVLGLDVDVARGPASPPKPVGDKGYLSGYYGRSRAGGCVFFSPRVPLEYGEGLDGRLTGR